MTLELDQLGVKDQSVLWTILCDHPGCHDHLHVGIERSGTDPRLAAEITGWALDVDGKDYCQEHRP